MNNPNVVNAHYEVTGLSHYDGNPLIEALPRILDEIDVVRFVGNIPPKPTEHELSLPPKLRGHCVNRLKDAVVPLEIHLNLEDCFSQLLRYGYTSRNPFWRDTVAMLHSPELDGIKGLGFKSSASIITLIGLSGMGKTTALNSIARLYPQVIKHNKYKGKAFIQTQVVWLKIECPHDGSLRGFCAAFFSSLDNALGIDKYSQLMSRRFSASVMLQQIGQLCRTYFIGALIIDEMQHLNSSRGGLDKEKLLNFFVTLSNDAGISLVYVGTNAMLPLFSGVLRNARRAVGMGEITFDRFDRDDPFWRHLLDQLWEYDWSGSSQPMTEKLVDKIYDLTQGNTDFLVKLLILAQRFVISEGLPEVSESVLQKVYNEQMRILHKPIEALRSGDPLQIADFEDMMPTKDQIAQMMNQDLLRRARRADLALVASNTILGDKAIREKPVSNPLTPVSTDSQDSVSAQIAMAADVEVALLQKGWIDDGKSW